jgi:outer membrane protein
MDHRIVPVLAVLALAGTAGADRIAFVDVRRAISECAEGKEVQKTLATEVEAKKKELEEKQAAVRKLGEELEKQESVLKPSELASRRKELQEKFFQVEREIAAFKQSLQQKEAAAVRPLADKMLLVIAAIAQREKLSHVLRQDVVLWTESRALDLTNEVIRLSDAAYAKWKEKSQKGEKKEGKEEKKAEKEEK